jgi:hypothetical protein
MKSDEIDNTSTAEKVSKDIYVLLAKELLKSLMAITAGVILVTVGTVGGIIMGVSLLVLSFFFLARGALTRYRHGLNCKHIRQNYLSTYSLGKRNQHTLIDLTIIKEEVAYFNENHAAIAPVTRSQINLKREELDRLKPNIFDSNSQFYRDMYLDFFNYLSLDDHKKGVSDYLQIGGYLYMQKNLAIGSLSEQEGKFLKLVNVELKCKRDFLPKVIDRLRLQKDSNKVISNDQKLEIENETQSLYAEMVASYEYWQENFSKPLLALLDVIEEEAGNRSTYSKFLSYLSQDQYESCYLGGYGNQAEHVGFILTLAQDLKLDFSNFMTFKSLVRALKKSITSLEGDKINALSIRYFGKILDLNLQNNLAAPSSVLENQLSSVNTESNPTNENVKGHQKNRRPHR